VSCRNTSSLDQGGMDALRADEGHEAQRERDCSRGNIQNEDACRAALILARCIGEGRDERAGQNICTPKEGIIDALEMRVSKS